MSETNAQEPTMEEILASIRRIISEDETPAAASPEAAEDAPPEPVAAEAAAEPPPPPKAEAPKPDPVKAEKPKPKADVLELTQRVEAAAPDLASAKAPPPPLGDIDFSDAPPPPAAAAAPKPAPRPPAGGSLVSDTAATAAAGHFGQLAQSVAPAPSGRSLEELVSEMLRPMLKDWLDTHLPKIVEASVAAEVERISRRGY